MRTTPELTASDQARPKRSKIRALRKSGIPVVKIIDFGLAKAFHTATDPKSLTHDRFVGTPAFASPEQFEHSALDVRSDIYSLGETLWFALTGRTPFAGRTLLEIHRAQKSNALPIEQLRTANVSHGLRSLLGSMLAFEPVSRPGTHELAARLKRCSPEARSMRRSRLGLAAAFTLILGATGFFAFRSLHTQNLGLNPPVAEKSIAVLPFDNLSEDKANAYFAEGIQDEILTRLSKISDLKVISRTSTQHYKSAPKNLPDIARQLGVAHILEGSVQKSGDTVRINVQLIKAANDSHLWGDTFDRKFTDIFAVESEVAQKIAASLQAELSGRERQALKSKPTNNPEAYDLYLRGRYFLNKRTVNEIQKGRALFEQAVARDPQFALGHAGIAESYIWLGKIGAITPAEASRQAWSEVSLALAIDDKLAAGCVSRAILLADFEWNWPAAEADYRKALDLDPNDSGGHYWYARGLVEYGRIEDAMREVAIAQKLDPLSAAVGVIRAKILSVAGRYDDAIKQSRAAIDLEPGFASAFSVLAQSYLFNKQPAEGIEAAKKYVELSAGSGWAKLELAFAYATAGSRAEAERIVRETIASRDHFSPYDMATIYAAWRETDSALQWLRQAVEQRSVDVVWIRVDPRLDNIRPDPRFQEIVKKMTPD